MELAGQIREVGDQDVAQRVPAGFQPEDARVLLFDGGTAPLAMFGPKLSALAARDLSKLGVELHMGSIVTHVDAGGLEVEDRDGQVTRYEAGNVCGPRRGGAAAGHRVAKATGAERDRQAPVVQGSVPARSSRHLWWPGT